ncbi:MAG: hypothetical protein OEW62_11555 [Candidatus Bathyarchaeota archaeon]|nr:hypothetical protein [Candidatus Bathyarchaeota archaeon]
MKPSTERCRNPWNDTCKNTDIEVYIYYKGRQLPICRHCWRHMADENVEW